MNTFSNNDFTNIKTISKKGFHPEKLIPKNINICADVSILFNFDDFGESYKRFVKLIIVHPLALIYSARIVSSNKIFDLRLGSQKSKRIIDDSELPDATLRQFSPGKLLFSVDLSSKIRNGFSLEIKMRIPFHDESDSILRIPTSNSDSLIIETKKKILSSNLDYEQTDNNNFSYSFYPKESNLLTIYFKETDRKISLPEFPQPREYFFFIDDADKKSSEKIISRILDSANEIDKFNIINSSGNSLPYFEDSKFVGEDFNIQHSDQGETNLIKTLEISAKTEQPENYKREYILIANKNQKLDFQTANLIAAISENNRLNVLSDKVITHSDILLSSYGGGFCQSINSADDAVDFLRKINGKIDGTNLDSGQNQLDPILRLDNYFYSGNQEFLSEDILQSPAPGIATDDSMQIASQLPRDLGLQRKFFSPEILYQKSKQFRETQNNLRKRKLEEALKSKTLDYDLHFEISSYHISDFSEIRNLIAENLPKIKENILESMNKPIWKANIVLMLEIDPYGEASINSSKVKETAYENIDQLIIKKLQKIKFPKSSGEANRNFTCVFDLKVKFGKAE